MKRFRLFLMAFILTSVGMQAATEKTLEFKFTDTDFVVGYTGGEANSVNATTGELTLGANSSCAWDRYYATEKFDLSESTNFVVKLKEAATQDLFVVLSTDGFWGTVGDNGTGYIGTLAAGQTELVIPLTGIKNNQEGKTKYGEAIDLTKINMINLWTGGGGAAYTYKIDAVYAEKVTPESGSTKTYFTVSDEKFSLTLWGDTNTKDADNNAFTLAADGNSVGWDYYYSGKLDISSYDRLVVKLKSVSDNKAVHFRVFGMKDADNEAPGNYDVELTADNNYTATIYLADGITTNSDLGDNTATAIDLTKINSLRFWAWAGEVTVTIDEIYLEKDGETPTDITKDNSKTTDNNDAYTEVYTVGTKTLTVAVGKTTDEGAQSAATHGTVTATGAVEGGKMVITLTVTPDAKHELDGAPIVEIVADDSNGDTPGYQQSRRLIPNTGKYITPTLQSNGTYTFDMPDANVKVSAKFKKLPPKPVALPVVAYDEPNNTVALTLTAGDDEHEADVKMYYTTVGSDPTTSETRTELTANGNIEVTAGMTAIKVVAVDEEGNYSDVVEQAVSRVRYLTVTKEWTAFSSPETFAVPDGLKAYTIQSVTAPMDGESGTVTLKAQLVINKNTPMLIENTVIGENTTKFRIESASDQTFNSDEMCSEFKGVSTNTTLEDNGSTYYVLKDGTFLRCNPGMVYAWNCYLEFSAEAPAAGARSYVIVIGDGHTTNIDTIGTATISEGQWYNLNGVRIPRPTVKGIYILDGKKVMIK